MASTRRCASTASRRSEVQSSSIFIVVVAQVIAVQLQFTLSDAVETIAHVALRRIRVLDTWKVKSESGEDQTSPVWRFLARGLPLVPAQQIGNEQGVLHRRSKCIF